MGVNGHWYVELEKQGYWRGKVHTWVNRYVMSGAQPTAAQAATVITDLYNIEQSIYPITPAGHGAGHVAGKAYPSGRGGPFQVTWYNESLASATATGYSGGSTAYTSLGEYATLENCLVVETKLAGNSSSGKPVYLRKYFRGINAGEEGYGGTPIAAGDLAEVNGYALYWKTGLGANDWVVIGDSGAQAAEAPAALNYIGNRQVPKGRKKKTSSNPLAEILADANKLKGVLQDIPILGE